MDLQEELESLRKENACLKEQVAEFTAHFDQQASSDLVERRTMLMVIDDLHTAHMEAERKMLRDHSLAVAGLTERHDALAKALQSTDHQLKQFTLRNRLLENRLEVLTKQCAEIEEHCALLEENHKTFGSPDNLERCVVHMTNVPCPPNPKIIRIEEKNVLSVSLETSKTGQFRCSLSIAVGPLEKAWLEAHGYRLAAYPGPLTNATSTKFTTYGANPSFYGYQYTTID